MSDQHIGPMLACALGDGYGAGFEYAKPQRVRQHNDLSGYIQHHKWKGMKPGHYTDDAQMALALAKHMLSGRDWSFLNLADAWVNGFHRDPREGYAQRFWAFLKKTKTGTRFLKDIRPHSSKSGGAMRAFPVGFLLNTQEVRDKAMFQASLTHATFNGMAAAAASALLFHYCYHNLGPRAELPYFLDAWVPGCEFDVSWEGRVGPSGLASTRAALAALVDGDSLADVLQRCIAWTGDVDTVAAIAMPAAAVCVDVDQTFPQVLIDGLEDGKYGRTHLMGIDQKLAAKFPRSGEREAKLEAAREARREAEAKPKPKPDPDAAVNPIAFLFADDDDDD